MNTLKLGSYQGLKDNTTITANVARVGSSQSSYVLYSFWIENIEDEPLQVSFCGRSTTLEPDEFVIIVASFATGGRTYHQGFFPNGEAGYGETKGFDEKFRE